MSSNIALYFYNVKSDTSLPLDSHYAKDFNSLNEAIFACEKEYAFIADATIFQLIDFSFFEKHILTEDMIHCGALFGSDKILQSLQITALSWFFLSTSPTKRSVNWKASPQIFVVKCSSWKKVGGMRSFFQTPTIAIMDVAYRMLRSGGEIFYDPLMLKEDLPTINLSSTYFDEFLFASHNLHKKAAVTLFIYRILHSFRWILLYQSLRRALMIKRPSAIFQREGWAINKLKKLKSIPRYSAIIPTLNRYDYLPAAINSLLNQTIPPAEIVVYDQTSKENRDPGIFDKFDSSIVKIIYSDELGQSSARNNALKHATQEWCLLFDDDSVAFNDMAERHIALLENSNYMVSTGASLAPGQQFSDLPYEIDFFHLADVLDTGNCFIHKLVLQSAGFFDVAFNRGPGADNDLGTRIHIKGNGIVFNPKAVRIHYKATSGGLRTFGVWWRFKTTIMGPYPPPSQTYTIQKYYPRKFWNYLYFRFFLKAAYRQNIWQLILLWLMLPFKLGKSLQEAKKLKRLKMMDLENTASN